MTYLFSEQTEKNSKYVTASKETDKRVEPPVTKLDLVKR